MVDFHSTHELVFTIAQVTASGPQNVPKLFQPPLVGVQAMLRVPEDTMPNSWMDMAWEILSKRDWSDYDEYECQGMTNDDLSLLDGDNLETIERSSVS